MVYHGRWMYMENSSQWQVSASLGNVTVTVETANVRLEFLMRPALAQAIARQLIDATIAADAALPVFELE